MRVEGEVRPRFKTRLGIFSKPQIEVVSSGVSLPPEEVAQLMTGMDLLKMGGRSFQEDRHGRINYVIFVKVKEREGLSNACRKFLQLGEGGNGKIKVGLSYEQRDFGTVRRVASVEHKGRRIELAIRPNEEISELKLERPAKETSPLSEENRSVLVRDALVIIKSGLDKLSLAGAGSS